MPEILLKLAKARPHDRIQRIELPVESFAICPWDPTERAQLALNREQAAELCAWLERVLYGVTLARTEPVTVDCHNA